MNSVGNQIDFYEKKLKSSAEYEFMGIYNDAGISGSNANRPGFQTMMEAAGNDQVDVIVTKSIFRFVRKIVILLENIRQFREWGVAVIFKERGPNTITGDGELLITVLASFAEQKRKSVSENMRWSKRNRFKRGEAFINTNKVIGYTKDENSDLVIDQEQAPIVWEIFGMYLFGLSFEQIRRQKVPLAISPFYS